MWRLFFGFVVSTLLALSWDAMASDAAVTVVPLAPGAVPELAEATAAGGDMQIGLAPLVLDAIVDRGGCGAVTWSHSPLPAAEVGPWCVAVAQTAGGGLLVLGRPGERVIVLVPMRIEWGEAAGEVTVQRSIAVAPSPALVAAVTRWAGAPGGAPAVAPSVAPGGAR